VQGSREKRMSDGVTSGQSLGLKEIPLKDLDFDPANPRLPDELQPRTQPALLSYLSTTKALEQLGESMARVGYFDEEPLLVVPSDHRYTVVEGNRRLAALRLLTDPKAREKVGATAWDRLADEAAQSGHTFEGIPCLVYGRRTDLIAFLGFRHVTGIAPWSAEAKARFIANLVLDYGFDFYQVGRAIGSRQDAVRRQFVAFQALRAAAKQDADTSLAEDHFGVWYRALQNPTIRAYVGVRGWNEGIEPDLPVLTGGIDRLVEALAWLFGEGEDGRDPPPVIRDSREIDKLGEVLKDERATALLRRTRNLAASRESLGGDRDILVGSLSTAHHHLLIALGQADLFAGDEKIIELADRVRSRANKVAETLSRRKK
jgi:hypothetical protein